MKIIGNYIKTNNDNYYFYSAYKNEIILTNRILYLIIQEYVNNKIKFNKTNVYKNTNKIETISPEIFKYYFDKFLLLKENQYFEKVDVKKKISGRIDEKVVYRYLSNTNMLTFEVTENCNLNCNYCGYGDFYNNNDKREKKNLEEKKAYKIIDYMIDLWNSYSCMEIRNKKFIGFYGGEPLLNYDLISKILLYIKDKKNNNLTFQPVMTTNGLLIDKYIDFIVENNFLLTISLDGDKDNNDYRLYHNGKSSFEKVYQNTLLIKNKYPVFFKSNVSFNAVLHNKNSVNEIANFFLTNFETHSQISELSTSGLNLENEKVFWNAYKNAYQSFKEASKCNSYIDSSMSFFLQNPSNKVLQDFSMSFCNIYYKSYSKLYFKKRQYSLLPTGTCEPFTKKIFITAKGIILPCEKVSSEFELGNISEEGVNINFEKISKFYNSLYSKISKQCNSCYYINNCKECLLKLDNAKCENFINNNDFNHYLENCITNIENKPANFKKIIENTTDE